MFDGVSVTPISLIGRITSEIAVQPVWSLELSCIILGGMGSGTPGNSYLGTLVY